MASRKTHDGQEAEPKGVFYDELILFCSTDGCINNGKDVFVHFHLLNEKVLLYFYAYGNPVCEHMWKQAKEKLDFEIEYIEEQGQLKYCPQCVKRIPKSSTKCPECGANLL